MSDELDLSSFPSSQKRQVIALAIQTFAAILPGASAASVLVSALLPELGKDRIAWFEYLAATVLQHEKRLSAYEESQEEQIEQFEQKLDEFVQRPTFRAAVLRTTDIALRDSLRKKWMALSNIVLQNTHPNPPDDDLQLMFLDYIATFGSWHLYLLKFFDKPRVWPISIAETPGGYIGQLSRSVIPFKVIELAIPELAQSQAFCMQCIADLLNRGLITLDANKLEYPEPSSPLTFSALVGQGPDAPAARLTTALGREFLQLTTDAVPV